MSINKTSLRLWAEEKVDRINYQINLGTILPVVGQAKIELLESLIDDFNLHEVRGEEIIYHNEY